jgi:L-lactate dehydrogenase complex protein LldG
MSRQEILDRVRSALHREEGQTPDTPPAARIVIPEVSDDEKLSHFEQALSGLGVEMQHVSEARELEAAIASLTDGRKVVYAPRGPLASIGLDSAYCQPAPVETENLRTACEAADFGLSLADYALADTGTLVLFAREQEPRLVSLLPAAYIGLVLRSRLLSGLDELFATHPRPAEESSSMVLLTGPSRTADIEQILVKGVHGPGVVHVIVLDDVKTASPSSSES